MKNLNIAGTVNSSSLVDVKGKGQHLKISVALNHVTPCEWIDVMTTKINLTIEKGSRVSATGSSEESAYINKHGEAALNRTLWASFFEILYSPGKSDEVTPEQTTAEVLNETPVETVSEVKASANVQEVKNPLEIAIEKIDAAKSIKQCNFLYHDVVKNLVDEEDRKIAQLALNSRKKALGYTVEKKAA